MKMPTATIAAIVRAYEEQRLHYEDLQRIVLSALDKIKQSCPEVHSYGSRRKDPTHLKDKLERRWRERTKKGQSFDVSTENFQRKINDLVGGRILHLHINQFARVHQAVIDTFQQNGHKLLGVEAKVWDPEYKLIFKALGIHCVQKLSLYTSVHYEFQAPGRKPQLTYEIQVRTLAEELWGEADHLINYPHPCEFNSCREQILALARATSACTRLVDSLMTTFREEKERAREAAALRERPLRRNR